MTVVEEIYEQLEVDDPEFWNADMILDWLKENKERYLEKEQRQLERAKNIKSTCDLIFERAAEMEELK